MYIYAVINWTGILQHFEIRIHKKITPKIQSVDRESHTVSLMFHDMQTTKGVDRVSHTMIWKGNESCVYTHMPNVSWLAVFVCL